MTTQLREAIARLRSRLHRGLQEHDDTVLICDALEAHLKPAPKFDKVAYQREYMRKRRSDAAFEKSCAGLHKRKRGEP